MKAFVIVYLSLRKINKNKEKLSSFYSACSAIYKREGLCHKLRSPSEGCVKLKERITKKYKHNFKTTVSPEDRMNVKPVTLEIDENTSIPEKNTLFTDQKS